MAHGLGFRDEDLERAPRHLLRRAAHARLARAGARDRRRRAAARRAHQPPRHRVAGVARADARRARRGGRARRARPLVPGGGRHGRARAGRPAALALLRRHAGTSGAREQAAREIALGKAIDKQQAEIERMERFIERFRYKATKARQAQSRVKKLAKIERIERDPDATGQEPGVRASRRRSASGRVIFELLGRPRRDRASAPLVLLEHAELWLERGEHVSLVGPNGTGKTTLIETLAGRRALAAGKLSTGPQREGRLPLPARRRARRGRRPPDAERARRGAARDGAHARTRRARCSGRFLFSGEEAEKPLAGLSGGERRRLSLAVLVQSGANVLILDEPTNHLDIESREALEDALRRVPGGDAARLPRPRAARRGRHAHGRGRGARAAQLRRRLAGVRARARGARRAPGARASRCGARPRARPQRLAPGAADAPRRGARASAAPTRSRQRAAQAQAEAEGPFEEPPQRAAEGRAGGRSRPRRRCARSKQELADPAAWATRYEAAKSEARHTAATARGRGRVRAARGARSTAHLRRRRAAARLCSVLEPLKTARNVAIIARDRGGRLLHPRRRARGQHLRRRSLWVVFGARHRLPRAAPVPRTPRRAARPRRPPPRRCSTARVALGVFLTWRARGCGRRASASSLWFVLVALVVYALLEVYRHSRSY